jgi:hypothetical protein
MTAMHPASGVPASDAKNTIPSNVEQSVNCDELWYSTSRCQPRFDPAAANAVLAELINLINKGEVTYDCNYLDQVQLASRYLIQRGLTRACLFAGGPFAYSAQLDPPVTRYNDYMTLTVVPNVDNQGAVTLDLGGLGPRQVLRNDGLQMRSKDFKSGKPEIIAFWAGSWYVCGLVSSQVPLTATGAVDAWVRTDGNDATGDGTANSPDKAFRTIEGAWNAVGGRYAASPLFSINIRLGIPGNYERAYLGAYGGNVAVIGDPNNKSAYRIISHDDGNICFALLLSPSRVDLVGINLVMATSSAPPNGNSCLRTDSKTVWINNCQFTMEATSGECQMIMLSGGCQFSTIGNILVEGNGNTCKIGLGIDGARHWGASPGQPLSNWVWQNINFSVSGHHLQNAAVADLGNMTYTTYNCTGSRYSVTTNAVLYQHSMTMPGNAAGTVGSQGQVF